MRAADLSDLKCDETRFNKLLGFTSMQLAVHSGGRFVTHVPPRSHCCSARLRHHMWVLVMLDDSDSQTLQPAEHTFAGKARLQLAGKSTDLAVVIKLQQHCR